MKTVKQLNATDMTKTTKLTMRLVTTCIRWLVHWPWWVGCYIWYSEEGTGRGRSLPTQAPPRCTKC